MAPSRSEPHLGCRRCRRSGGRLPRTARRGDGRAPQAGTAAVRGPHPGGAGTPPTPPGPPRRRRPAAGPPRSGRSRRAASPRRAPRRVRGGGRRARSARAASGAAPGPCSRGHRPRRPALVAAWGSGCRRKLTRAIRASRPSRPADEAAEVVARDVLHDLPAGVRDRPVGEHEGHAEDEVSGRAEAMSKRARDVRREQRADRRVAGRVEREALPMTRKRRVQLGQPEAGLDRAGEVARLVLEDPVEPARQVGADANLLPAGRRGREQCRGLLEARDARQGPSSRARGRDTDRGPRRRAGGSGRPSRDCRGPRDRTPRGGV